jgi:hypothetical protein
MICSGGLRNAGRTGSMQAGQPALFSRARDSSPAGIQTKGKRARMDGLAGYDYVFYPGPRMNANKVKILQQGSAAGAFPELAAGAYPTAITSDTITFHGSLRNCSSRSRLPNPCSRKRANGYEQWACHEGSTNHVYRIFFSAADKRLRHLGESLLNPSDVPAGMSPSLGDVEFFPGGVRTRPGPVSQFSARAGTP